MKVFLLLVFLTSPAISASSWRSMDQLESMSRLSATASHQFDGSSRYGSTVIIPVRPAPSPVPPVTEETTEDPAPPEETVPAPTTEGEVEGEDEFDAVIRVVLSVLAILAVVVFFLLL